MVHSVYHCVIRSFVLNFIHRSKMIQRAFTAEIPIRMDRLRVSTDEEEHNTVLQDMAIDNSFDNIPLNYLSPSASPSPDEMIIRQRGTIV